MKVTVAYVYVCNAPLSDTLAARFASTWHAFPPEVECSLLVICNGGVPAFETEALFAGLDAKFYPRSNEGWDCGGYIEAAKGPAADCDLLVCLGESVHFWRRGWLQRLVETAEQFGPGMYGTLSSYLVRPHMALTAFAISPWFLTRYPFRVYDRKSRYACEHGTQSLWLHLENLWHWPVRLVTWDGSYPWRDWRKPPNILWRGDQSNCLVRANHIERFEQASDRTKQIWSRGADGLNMTWNFRMQGFLNPVTA